MVRTTVALTRMPQIEDLHRPRRKMERRSRPKTSASLLTWLVASSAAAAARSARFARALAHVSPSPRARMTRRASACSRSWGAGLQTKRPCTCSTRTWKPRSSDGAASSRRNNAYPGQANRQTYHVTFCRPLPSFITPNPRPFFSEFLAGPKDECIFTI